jgi:hypothetical protein
MQKKTPKIQYIKYLSGSILILAMIIYFSGTNRNITASLIVLVGNLLNHLMLYRGGLALLDIAPNNKLRAFLYFGGKAIILGGALYASYSIAPTLILYSLIQYIFQLIILVLSIKR